MNKLFICCELWWVNSSYFIVIFAFYFKLYF